MYQIILSHWGLSLGEIETINSIFSHYQTIETNISKSTDYASTLEIEFVKNSNEDFFGSIPIEKWNEFVDITKNIKKRRGNKGLKFKMTITECIEDTKKQVTLEMEEFIQETQSQEDQSEIELLFCRRIIFLLLQKRDSDFIKGLERIEINIENQTDLFNKISESPFPHEDEVGFATSNMNIDVRQLSIFRQIQLFIFVFDCEKRIWKNL